MSESLYEKLLEYNKLNRISFHTPGHKRKKLLVDEDLYSLDLTELPSTDSLYDAKDIILDAERKMSSLFNTKRTCYSTGGCTLCIQSMILSATKIKKKIILGRTIHKSAINTIALLGLDPYFVMPRNDSGKHLPGRIHPDDIAEALEKNNDAGAVYITSPDYFGVMSDIKEISKECKKRGVPLIVDNAHGSHLKFLREDVHPISLGATMSADSIHKTLPVLTSGALLQIGDENYCDDIKSIMSVFGSTSPSYPVMASIDLCREWLENKGKKEYRTLQSAVEELKKKFLDLGIQMPIGMCDPIRLSLCTESVGINGLIAADFLREQGIEPEYANDCYVVFIITPMNSESELNILYNVILKLLSSNDRNFKVQKNISRLNFLPESCISPRDALFSQKRTVNVISALNQICAETVSPCPPGIPIVMPGERITLDVIELLSLHGISKIRVVSTILNSDY